MGDIILLIKVVRRMSEGLSVLPRELFWQRTHNIPDRRSAFRQKYISGWVRSTHLSLATQNSTP